MNAMNHVPFTLAAADNLVEVLFGVVFFLIWVASAAMSTLSKQREKQRRERVRMEIQTGRPMPLPSPPQQMPQQQPRPIQRTAAVRQAPKRVSTSKTFAPPRPAAAKRRPVPVEQAFKKAPPLQPPKPPVPLEAIAPRPAAQPQKATSAANAQTLHSWLRPQTLRKQFILTELLQPPLALRDPDANRLL